MLTRAMDAHQYTAADYPDVVYQGAVRTETVNNVPTTWPIARPSAFPQPIYNPPAQIQRGQQFPLQPPVAKTQMDPSDPSTWQRQYRFT